MVFGVFLGGLRWSGPDPEIVLPGGGGALEAEVLNRAAKAAGGGAGESMGVGLNPPLIRGPGKKL